MEGEKHRLPSYRIQRNAPSQDHGKAVTVVEMASRKACYKSMKIVVTQLLSPTICKQIRRSGIGSRGIQRRWAHESRKFAGARPQNTRTHCGATRSITNIPLSPWFCFAVSLFSFASPLMGYVFRPIRAVQIRTRASIQPAITALTHFDLGGNAALGMP